MRRILNLDQDHWVTVGRFSDVQIQGGVCVSLCYHWLVAIVNDSLVEITSVFRNDGPSWSRIISFQRAFNYQVDDQTNGATYNVYYARDELVTSRMSTQNGRRDGATVNRRVLTPNRGVLTNWLGANLNAGTFTMLCFWGVDNGENWGHATALVRTNRYIAFFDPNHGIYLLNPGTFAGDVLDFLDDEYDWNCINHYGLYEFS